MVNELSVAEAEADTDKGTENPFSSPFMHARREERKRVRNRGYQTSVCMSTVKLRVTFLEVSHTKPLDTSVPSAPLESLVLWLPPVLKGVVHSQQCCVVSVHIS